MKVILVYISPNATTRKISKELALLFSKSNHQVIEIDIGKGDNRNFSHIDLNVFKDADLIGIGSPIYHMSILEPLYKFLEEYLPKIATLNKNLKAFIYLTYAGITSGKAFMNALKLLKKNEIGLIGALKVYAPHFWDINSYPYNDTLSFIKDFYTQMQSKNFAEMEWEKAKNLFSYQKPIVNLIYPFTHVIGKVRQLDISIDNSKCIKCSRCCNECPVDAFTMEEFPIRDKSKCIYCYHCTTICAKNAFICDTNKVKDMVKRNKRIVGTELPQNRIFL